ncbi:hypothetical protein M9Y10_010365 [Tritrichomonas musculus]|uniref:Uncharacterized protein n=1 Tax=Tritrichomonas musculus TaxID=1915356 RepID=A0ABR2IKK4_9EUKA
MIPRNIELNRLIACTPEKIDINTNTLFEISSIIELVFSFYSKETMLSQIMHRELLVPNNTKTLTLPDEMTLPHISAMCCCNVLREKMPPFIILPSFLNLPTDYQIHVKSGEAMFAGRCSGWKTSNTFICFAKKLLID